jgi:glucose/arabinose dehydrogenase
MLKRTKIRLVLGGAIVVLLVVLALNFGRLVDRLTVQFGSSFDISPAGITKTRVPDGFSVNVYASNLSSPRFMAVGPDGTIFVAEQGGGRVSALPDRDKDGEADERITVADGLTAPSSLAFLSGNLLVGEHDEISRLTIGPDYKATSHESFIPGLPASGGHLTKSVLVGRDGRVYVASGSTCNVCDEADERRAAVSVYNADGSGGRVFARGLRNAVGLAINPWSGELWATNNGRDLMGDERPPETVYVLRDGANYGWPRCHAGNIIDPDMGGPGACASVEQPVVKLAAHMAPLGLAFYREGTFPAPYNDSLYIAMHGSWNSSRKVGYKVMRVPLKDGEVAGEGVDFMTGFLRPDGAVPGRPAGVTVAQDGSLLVSDDKGGYIYRVAWGK